MSRVLSSLLVIFILGLAQVFAQAPVKKQDSKTTLTKQTSIAAKLRQDLIQARDRAWRSFFQSDPGAIEEILAPELIAIQESQEQWETRTRLLAMAREMTKQQIELRRLEFPRTEIEVFGKTAILYYSYIFETGTKGQPSVVTSGRGTEVFVKRQGKWIDVGWHLDNGAFRFKNGSWTKISPQPQPSS
jgi:ketosteroid isomerase-like protein